MLHLYSSTYRTLDASLCILGTLGKYLATWRNTFKMRQTQQQRAHYSISNDRFQFQTTVSAQQHAHDSRTTMMDFSFKYMSLPTSTNTSYANLCNAGPLSCHTRKHCPRTTGDKQNRKISIHIYSHFALQSDPDNIRWPLSNQLVPQGHICFSIKDQNI